jgi:hypothetical protein
MIRLAIIAALVAAPAYAQQAPKCGPRDQVVRNLAAKYGEEPIVVGMNAGGLLYEVYHSPASGTWTALVTRPDGTSCMADAGEAMEVADRVKPGDAM